MATVGEHLRRIGAKPCTVTYKDEGVKVVLGTFEYMGLEFQTELVLEKLHNDTGTQAAIDALAAYAKDRDGR